MRLLRLHRLHLRQLHNLRLHQLHNPHLHRPLDLPQQLPLQRELRLRQMFRTNFFNQLCVV